MKILISFFIYSFFFFKLGNTLIREDSIGNKNFSLKPLFTEGIFGPIRSLFLIIIHSNLSTAFKYLTHEFFRLSNPISAYIFVNYISKVISYNIC